MTSAREARDGLANDESTAGDLNPKTAVGALRRVILLGASNVTLGFPLLLQQLRQRQSGPLDIFAAHGHGRSYGRWSRALGRELPGILDCGIWQALQDSEAGGESEIAAANDAASPMPTAALITDVGNDLVYGVEPQVLLDWVRTILDRVMPRCAEITLLLPPLQNIRQLDEARFQFFRKILFPTHPVELAPLREKVEELFQGLTHLAETYQIRQLVPPLDWYAVDPIHVRWRRRSIAWQSVLSHWSSFPPLAPRRMDWPWQSFQGWTAKPEILRNRKGTIETPQPSLIQGQLRVHLY